MLFIVLVANWYGVGTGVLVGLAYGILQFIQEPYVLLFSKCAVIIFWHLQLLVWQDCKKKHGLLKGYIAAVWQEVRFTHWGIFVLDGLHAR